MPNKSTKKHSISCIIGAAVSLVAVFAAYLFGSIVYHNRVEAQVEDDKQRLLHTSTFHNGIVINGVSVGGMTMQEAEAAMAQVEKDLIADVGFFLSHERASIIFGAQDFDITYDTQSVLESAMLLAKEGEPELLRQKIADIEANGAEYTISYSIKPNQSALESKLQWLCDHIDCEPKDAFFEPNPESVYITEDTYNGIEQPELLDDYISPDRFIFYEGEAGYSIDRDALTRELQERTEERDYGDIAIPAKIIEPEKSIDDIRSTIVKRSEFASSYASGSYGVPDRIFNVKKACGLVNGTVVPPKNPDDDSDKSYIFSTNDTLGYRSLENGWRLAPGFVDGGANSEDSPGGGVCHVSSTLYNAVVKADLKIEYRINHSRRVGYVDGGLDATIDSGRIDFLWSNNTQHNIYVFMWVDTKAKLVRCEIYGEPFPEEFDRVEFYGKFVETIPIGETLYIQTASLAAPHWYIFNSPREGSKYESYKAYYKDGELVKGPIFVAKSEYRMHPQRIYVWKGFDPAVDVLTPEGKVPKPED